MEEFWASHSSWVMQQPAAFAVVVFVSVTFGVGLAWAVLQLIYGERITKLTHRAESAEARVKDLEVCAREQRDAPAASQLPPDYAYPVSGKFGINLLAIANERIRAGEYYSFKALIPAGGAVTARILSSEQEASWAASVAGIVNWDRREIVVTPNGVQQDWVASDDGIAEMKFSFKQPGVFVIEIYQAHSGTASVQKLLRVQ
ncbi:TPA: hypothetical protein UMY79_000805 [Stenotrophomonas maltophilia]|nr:hypothetical protein [Stenotrophomonas maltophilia]